MPRRKKSREPKNEPDQRSDSRDHSPPITTRLRQCSGVLILQYVMNGQTIWQESLVSKTGQPITCLKDLPAEIAKELGELTLDEAESAHDTSGTSTTPGSHGNQDQKKSSRDTFVTEKESAAPGNSASAQPLSNLFSATPLQPSLLPQNIPSNKTVLSPYLAQKTGDSQQPTVSQTFAQSVKDLQQVLKSGITRSNTRNPKPKRDMSFKELIRRTVLPNRREDREDRADQEVREIHEDRRERGDSNPRGRHEHREHDEIRRSHGHRAHRSHRRRSTASRRGSHRRRVSGGRSTQHRHRDNGRQEREHRRISLQPAFDNDWFCFQCGRLRSATFRSKYSLEDGELPKANFCRKCRHNAEEKDEILIFKGLRYYCFECGIVRSVVYHEDNRPLGMHELCPPNICTKCREVSRGFGDGIIQESEVGRVIRDGRPPARLNDVHEADEDDENVPRNVLTSRAVQVHLYRDPEVVETQETHPRESARINEPAQRPTSVTHRPPMVESTVDSEPELRAAQQTRGARLNDNNEQSARARRHQDSASREANNVPSTQSQEHQEQHQLATRSNTNGSRNWHPKDAGTQTDDSEQNPATRGRTPSSSSKSVHWPSDEELSTAREYQTSRTSHNSGPPGPAGRSGPPGPSGHAAQRGGFPPGGPDGFHQRDHRSQDPRTVSSGSPPERFESQSGSNTTGTANNRSVHGDASTRNANNRGNGTADDRGGNSRASSYASNFSHRFANYGDGLPSARDIPSGMPNPTRPVSPGFYTSSATSQASTARPPESRSRPQDFHNPNSGPGDAGFSMPDRFRSFSGPHMSSTGMINDDRPVPVPEVATTCECDFDALFQDMPAPDMNDEFYSHRPTAADLEAANTYARELIDSLNAVHSHQVDDDEGEEESPSDDDGSDDHGQMYEHGETGYQSDTNSWGQAPGDRYNSTSSAWFD